MSETEKAIRRFQREVRKYKEIIRPDHPYTPMYVALDASSWDASVSVRDDGSVQPITPLEYLRELKRLKRPMLTLGEYQRLADKALGVGHSPWG